MKLVFGALLAMVMTMPSVADACSCVRSRDDLAKQLRDELASSTNVLLVQVLATDGLDDDGVTELRVDEVFKGQNKLKQKLKVRSGGGGDCTHRFSVGQRWLVYSAGNRVGVHVCSRSRPVEDADIELAWLRTAKPPLVPVALQRAFVRCQPCEQGDVAAALTGLSTPSRGVTPLRKKQPFRTESSYDQGRSVVLGISTKKRAFELVRSSVPAEEACRSRITRRWCDSLQFVDGGSRGEVFCAQPGEPETVCDENVGRTEDWEPPERLGSAVCSWRDPQQPSCTLGAAAPLDGGQSVGPILRCVPKDGSASTFTCQVVTP